MENIRRGKRAGCTLLCILLLVIAGCGKPNGSQIEEDLSEADGTGIATGADAGGVGEIPEHVSYEMADNGGSSYVSVDAEVIVPEVSSYSVYEETRIDVDDTFLKELAEKLFDDGTYEQVKPAWMCTSEELVSEQAYVEALARRYAGEDLSGYEPTWLYNLRRMYCGMSYEDSEGEALAEGKLIYKYTLDYGEPGENFTDWYESCTLRGDVDGEEWLLYYENFEEYGALGLQNAGIGSPYIFAAAPSRKLVLVPANPREYHWISVKSRDDYLDASLYGENSSDEALCRQMVNDFAQRLGLADDMEIAAVYNLLLTDSEGNGRLDGYRMYMVPVVNGIQNYFSCLPCLSAGDLNDGSLQNEDTEDWYAYQEYIAFDVSSEGVCGVYIGDMYDLGECMTKQANMLSFEQIDMLAQEYMASGLYANGDITIDSIQLSYATLRYEGKYSIVPVWIYYREAEKNTLYPEQLFGINALDGSLVSIMYLPGYDYMFY